MSKRRPKRKVADAALDEMHSMRSRDDLVSQPIFPPLPKDLYLNILKFLSKPDLVHRASLVSLSFCRASRNPVLWEALEADVWNRDAFRAPANADRPFLDASEFSAFLRRPQFARLKRLVPPDMPYVPVFGDQIAVLSHSVKDLDISGSTSLASYYVNVARLPVAFPNLEKLRLLMTPDIKCKGLREFALRIGDRLVGLYVIVTPNGNVICDKTMEAIAQNCPNLVEFSYFSEASGSHGRLSEQGLTALLEVQAQGTSWHLSHHGSLSSCTRICGGAWPLFFGLGSSPNVPNGQR